MRSKIPGDLVAAVIIPIGHRMHCFSWIRHRNVYKVTRNSSGLYTYSGFSRDSLGKKWHLSKSEMLPEKAPQHFGEYVHIGSNDEKISAGELR